MDGSVSQVVYLWEEGGLVILLLLTGIVVFHHLTKLWGTPFDVALGVILGASVGLACAALYFSHHWFGLRLGGRAFWFGVLYLWCVLGMTFFATKRTHKLKLFLGLASQAGIVYALFLFV